MFWAGVLAAYAVPTVAFIAYLLVNQLRDAIDRGYIAITKHFGLIRGDVFALPTLRANVVVKVYLAVTPRWRILWAYWHPREREDAEEDRTHA